MACRLRSDLIKHPGEKGTAREAVIREFLTSHLPTKFRVSTGFVFDCHGTLSKQLDIVIVDASICPIFEAPGGKFLFPCEAVVAAGEVKSVVRSKRELVQALDGLIGVKGLDRSANGVAVDCRSWEPLEPKTNYLDQIFTFLFICGESIHGSNAAEQIMELVEKTPIHQMPNAILSFDKYLVSYCCDGGVCPNVMHARGVSCRFSDEKTDVLQQFYIMLGRAIDVTRVASLPFWEYLSKQQGSEAVVFCDSRENPPRYLAAIAPTDETGPVCSDEN